MKRTNYIITGMIIFLIAGMVSPNNFWAGEARAQLAPPVPEEERVEEGLPFPRLANTYYRTVIREADIDMLSGWDLLVFAYVTDRDQDNRNNIVAIESLNPDIIFLIYHGAWAVGDWDNPPDPLFTAAEEYDWWLYDYLGNKLRDELWDVWKINMTNEEAAKGTHPLGMRPNEFLPQDLVNDHLHNPDPSYDFWDGIFYDVFTDNLQWFYLNEKDANRNLIPEYDLTHNGNEPIFNDIWQDGMITLLQNTLALEPDAILVGNGLHRFATPYLNGKYGENYSPSPHNLSRNLSNLAPEYRYITDNVRGPATTILNGVPIDLHDPTDYCSMRFGLTSSLLIGSYYLFDSGSRHHKDTFWYDEYNIDIERDGEVAAVTTYLTSDITDTQLDIPVESTSGFPEDGVITIDGEQIYYDSKTLTSFHAMNSYYGRGYPDNDNGGEYDHRAPHENGAIVIHYDNSRTGYLGFPVSDAYDINDPSVTLGELFELCGWVCDEQEEDNIDSRVWIREFDNGAVILNASNETKTVTGLGEEVYKKIQGLQDPAHNDGQLVNETLTIGPKDGYILIKVQPINIIYPQEGQTIQTLTPTIRWDTYGIEPGEDLRLVISHIGTETESRPQQNSLKSNFQRILAKIVDFFSVQPAYAIIGLRIITDLDVIVPNTGSYRVPQGVLSEDIGYTLKLSRETDPEINDIIHFRVSLENPNDERPMPNPHWNNQSTDNDNSDIGSLSDMLETSPQTQTHRFGPDISVRDYLCKNKNEPPIIKDFEIDPSPPRENTLHTVTVYANDSEDGQDIKVLFDVTTGKIIQDTRDRFRAYWWIPEEAPEYADLHITVVDSCGFNTDVFALIDIQND